MELVVHGVVKVLEPRRICFSIDPRLTQLSQDVKVSTRLALIVAIALANRTLYSAFRRYKQSLK